MLNASPVPTRVNAMAGGKLFVIINPKSGSSDEEHCREILAKLKETSGLLSEVYVTTGNDDFRKVVGSALDKGYQVIAACGGDGTVSAVASELVGTSATCMIVPGGTANVLAKELGISQNKEEAIGQIVKPAAIKLIDAMEIEDKHFFSHVSLGIYSKIAEQTKPEIKRRFGRFAYIWYATKLMFGRRSWRFKIVADGTTYKVRGTTIMIASAGAVGGLGMRWSPDARADNGEVSICVIKAKTIGQYLRLFFSFFRNAHNESNLIQIVRAKSSIEIDNKSKLPIRGDGEIIGHGNLSVKIKPGSLRVLIPAATKN